MLICSAVVDVTRRQFEHDAAVPTIYWTLDEAGLDWCEYAPQNAAPDQYVPLPEHGAVE